MATPTLNFDKLFREIPAGAWVAVSEAENRVIAFGADLQQVLAEARDNGEPEPLVLKVPDRQEIVFL